MIFLPYDHNDRYENIAKTMIMDMGERERDREEQYKN